MSIPWLALSLFTPVATSVCGTGGRPRLSAIQDLNHACFLQIISRSLGEGLTGRISAAFPRRDRDAAAAVRIKPSSVGAVYICRMGCTCPFWIYSTRPPPVAGQSTGTDYHHVRHLPRPMILPESFSSRCRCVKPTDIHGAVRIAAVFKYFIHHISEVAPSSTLCKLSSPLLFSIDPVRV